jgi:gamma-glutamyltranspeptidase/glutathione hydrolase
MKKTMKGQTAFTAPHFLAAQTGQAILDSGGTAVEAMVAAAAMVAVQYPHMNSLGGDSFWLICKSGESPIAIDGCGAAAMQVDRAVYARQSEALPDSGGEAAITMAGTVAAWQKALDIYGGRFSLPELLQPAVAAAKNGITVTDSLAAASEKTFDRLASLSSFQDIYLPQGRPLRAGEPLINTGLADTLAHLTAAGLGDFYHGDLANTLANGLIEQGSPLRIEDFHRYQAGVTTPLSVPISTGKLFNFGAPTQGLASLLILAIYDRLAESVTDEVMHTHLLVEATKQAFIIRDAQVCDPGCLTTPLQDWLTDTVIEAAATAIRTDRAQPWPQIAKLGDTVWMGAVDQDGTMVSFIQSVYWEFGSGCVVPGTGITWNNRALSFSLDPQHHNVLGPGKKPFHTLNPAYAELADGRRIVYGTMGGEGQPQTQACLFSRYLYQGFDLAQAIAEPRWLLGRTWGDDTHQLRLEASLAKRIGKELAALGHDMTTVNDCNELMGHAGAIVLASDGRIQAASDPRSDGMALKGD